MSDKIREALLAMARRIEEAEGEPIHIDPRAAHHLRAALAQRPAPVAVPDGWNLVPVEPTIDMEDAGRNAADGYMRLGEAWSIYRAMLAAAPAAPVAQAPVAQAPVQMHHEPHNRAMWHENCPGRRFSSPMKPRGDGSWECGVCGAVGRVTAPPAAEQPNAAVMPCGTAVSNVYEAYEAGKKAAEQPDTIPVSRELLERIAPQLTWDSDEYKRIAALLAGGDKP